MRVLAHVLSFALLLFSASASAQSVPSVDAYGRLPLIVDAAMSPDGTRIMQAITSGADSGVRVINIDTGQTEHAFSAPEGTKVRGVSWADDRRAIFVTSESLSAGNTLRPGAWTGGRRIIEYWRSSVLDLRNGRSRYVEFGEDDDWMYTSTAGIVAPISDDPGSGRMISFDMEGRLALFRVNFDAGTARPAVVASRETVDIILNERGTIGARTDMDDRTNEWRVFYYGADGQPRQIMNGRTEASAMPGLVGFLPDGRIVMTTGRAGGDRNTLVAYNPDTGQRETLAENDRYDVGGASVDPWSHLVVGAAWTEDLPRRRYFDPSLQAVYDRLQQRFETGYATFAGWSRDRRRFLVFAETHEDAGAYYVYEPASDTLRLVGRLYPELNTVEALGNRQAITFRARDGQRVPAYLTLPAHVEDARNLPTVLLVHGGPHARDTFSFDWWASFLASRGYAVLQPNYRGSTGYGAAWFEAGRRGWGDGIMQTDVEDGLAALVRGGIADPNRVCIVGASYGGYAALAGATITPDVYDCAIAIAGVSDLQRMLDETVRIGGSDNSGAEWWAASIGDRNDRERISAISPANLAANVRVPVLIMHGPDDTVVPIAQSRIMRDRLQQAGKTVRYVELAGDDHWLSLASTRTQMLREIDSFLTEHLRRDRN